MDAPSIKVTYEEYLAGKHHDIRNDDFKSYNTIFTNLEYSNNKIFFIFKTDVSYLKSRIIIIVFSKV